MTVVHRPPLVVLFIVAAAVVSSAHAQRAHPGWQAPMYNASTEARFTGTVDAVTLVTPGHHRLGPGGTHLTLKTATETFEVHVGPTAFLKANNINIVKGDAVEILGSRVTIGGGPALLAREIKKGDSTWALRDASGRPLWSGGRECCAEPPAVHGTHCCPD